MTLPIHKKEKCVEPTIYSRVKHIHEVTGFLLAANKAGCCHLVDENAAMIQLNHHLKILKAELEEATQEEELGEMTLPRDEGLKDELDKMLVAPAVGAVKTYSIGYYAHILSNIK